jgi:hypothetical protein
LEQRPRRAGNFQNVAEPKSLTKMHWNWRGGDHPAWIHFNHLIGVYIESD